MKISHRNSSPFWLLHVLHVCASSPQDTSFRVPQLPGTTTALLPETTEPARLEVHHLLKRQDDESRTCGYFDGDANRPNLCGVSSYCLFAGAQFGCYGSGPVFTPTVCLTSIGSGPVVNPENGDTVTCPNQCQTTYFPSVAGAAAGTGPYTHVDCVATASPPLYLIQAPLSASNVASVTDSEEAPPAQVTRTVTQSPPVSSVSTSPQAQVTKTVVQTPSSPIETDAVSNTPTPATTASMSGASSGVVWSSNGLGIYFIGLVLCVAAMTVI